MDDLVIRQRVMVLGVMVGMLLLAWWPDLSWIKVREPLCDENLLCVVFLDVGQGDAIFIQSPSGRQMLVDTGRDQGVLRGLGEVMSFRDRHIDVIMVTHADADHIGGLMDVLERFEVSHMIRTENESDTALWQGSEREMNAEGATITMARRGQKVDLGSGVFLEILFPDTDPSSMETNTASIVARLTYGETSFLLTGDSPKSIEEYLVLIEGENLQSDVLKVGHHGSRTSTSEMFLDEVLPSYAVISAGKDNSYGHPHVEVTDALFNAGVEALSTAERGHVVFWSDGNELSVK